VAPQNWLLSEPSGALAIHTHTGILCQKKTVQVEWEPVDTSDRTVSSSLLSLEGTPVLSGTVDWAPCILSWVRILSPGEGIHFVKWSDWSGPFWARCCVFHSTCRAKSWKVVHSRLATVALHLFSIPDMVNLIFSQMSFPQAGYSAFHLRTETFIIQKSHILFGALDGA
jgi:hypothetical protein